MIGSRLGPYEIVAKLGEGGMGVVWRARDSHLDREVAIKVLPPGLTADVERAARFEREAKVLASLNHPNIAHIHGLEASGESRAIVMELVEGPTLADLLERGALPLEEAVAIARQVAEALEAAHEKGIVHRDLKPQNIKVTDEGQVKVLDFGLAKAIEKADGSSAMSDPSRSPTLMNSPTLTAVRGTELGVILGTASYMSPEQAKGQAVDKRADIWAFGVVLYEMLTGARLFDAPSVAETLALLLTRTPDLAALPAATPRPIRHLLARCLERKPKDRLRDIGEARIVLQGPFVEEAGAAAAPSPGRAARPGGSGVLRWGGWAIAAALAIAVAVLALRPDRPATTRELLRFTISSASGASISSGAGHSAISPDGRRVVFVGGNAEGRQGLWIQELDQVDAHLLADTEGASFPFWAPDSQRIGFFSKGKLRKAAVGGGRVEILADASEGRGGSWGRNGTIVFAATVVGGLSAVSENGGSASPVTRIEKPEEEQSHRFPSFLPDGRSFVYIADPGAGVSDGRVYLASLDRPERRLLYRSERAPVYAAPGYLIDAVGEHLVARRFDPGTGAVSGEPILLEESTPDIVNTQDRVASVSDTGALLVPSSEMGGTKVVWHDRRGRRLGEIPLPKERFSAPRLSPDGRRLLLQSDSARETEGDLWSVDLVSEQASRLSFTPGVERYGVWSPDSKEIAFQSDRGGVMNLHRQPASGGGAERPLYESADPWKQAYSWVGDHLAFVTVKPETGFDILLLDPDGSGEAPRPIAVSPASEIGPAISPDGRWLAYNSNESGRDEVYVVSVPDARTKFQVTTTGGRHAVWTRGGRELLYLTTGNSIAAVEVAAGEAPAFGPSATLFPLPLANWRGASAEVIFDVTADGDRIVMLEPENLGSQTLVVVTDWQAELGPSRGR